METKTKIIIGLFVIALVFAIIAVYLNISSSDFKPVAEKPEAPAGNPVRGFQLSIEPYVPANATGG